MTRRSPDEVYATLLAAGFTEASARTMQAIAGAESGYDDTAQGDQNVEDNTWGSSYGLFQIRTQKDQTGTGGDRDISRLAASDLEQARAAYDISAGGTDFSPWTTWRTGAYTQFLDTGGGPLYTSVAAGSGGGGGDQPWWVPWLNTAGGVAGNPVLGTTVNGAVDASGQELLSGARHIVIEGVAVVLGLALVGLGVWLAAQPALKGVAGVAGDVVGSALGTKG